MLPGIRLVNVMAYFFTLCSAAVAGAAELSEINGHRAEEAQFEVWGISHVFTKRGPSDKCIWEHPVF